MTTSGLTETFFVVASTDMNRAPIMTARIREQLGKLPELKAISLDVSARAVPLPDFVADQPLEERVREVAKRVTEMTRTIAAKQSFTN